MITKFKDYNLQLNIKSCRTLFYLSLVLFISACATAVVVEQTEVRENDDRTELQKQLDSEITKNIKN